MKLNKKYFLELFAVIGMQLVFGVGLANAVCDNEVDSFCRSVELRAKEGMHDWDWAIPYSKCKGFYEEELDFSKPNSMSVQETKDAIDYEGRFSTPQFANDKSTPVLQSHVNLCINKARLAYLTNKSSQSVGAVSRQDSANGRSNSDGSSISGISKQSKSNKQVTDSQSNQSNTSTPTASSQNQSNPQGNSSNGDSNTGLSMKPEQEVLVNTASQKYASESAAFEASHKGLKRTHNKEDEASRCLVIENRKIKNTCDYRVEYTFCAYKPNLKAFSGAFEMAAAFDCEQRKFGSAGISAKRVDAGTYTAEAVYVFGCKDPSLPRGVTYERGRGLSGRCSE